MRPFNARPSTSRNACASTRKTDALRPVLWAEKIIIKLRDSSLARTPVNDRYYARVYSVHVLIENQFRTQNNPAAFFVQSANIYVHGNSITPLTFNMHPAVFVLKTRSFPCILSDDARGIFATCFKLNAKHSPHFENHCHCLVKGSSPFFRVASARSFELFLFGVSCSLLEN